MVSQIAISVPPPLYSLHVDCGGGLGGGGGAGFVGEVEVEAGGRVVEGMGGVGVVVGVGVGVGLLCWIQALLDTGSAGHGFCWTQALLDTGSVGHRWAEVVEGMGGVGVVVGVGVGVGLMYGRTIGLQDDHVGESVSFNNSLYMI